MKIPPLYNLYFSRWADDKHTLTQIYKLYSLLEGDDCYRQKLSGFWAHLLGQRHNVYHTHVEKTSLLATPAVLRVRSGFPGVPEVKTI